MEQQPAGEGRGASAGSLLSGVEALARLLVVRAQLDAREGLTTATMVSGYPGSPLGTFDLTLERFTDLLTGHRVVHRPGLNEELAAATVWGSQMGSAQSLAEVDGVVGAWYGKTPGLDRCGDVLRHANAMGTGPHGGAVLFCGDDPSAKSSTLACDSQYTFEDACVPVLYPGDQQDILDLGVHAFRMSRYSGSWVGLKVVTAVADGIGTVDADVDRHTPSDPADADAIVAGVPWRHVPLARVGAHAVPGQEELVADHRLLAAQAYARHNGLDRVVGAGPGARLGVVCAGKTYFDVVQAFADLGLTVDGLARAGVRVLRLGMTYPLVAETALEFARSVDTIVVVEEKRPFVETQLRAILHEAGVDVRVAGKRDRDGRRLSSSSGELDAAAVATILTRVLPDLADRAGPAGGPVAPRPVSRPALRLLPLLDIPARPPGFCSGCPHNRSTVAPDGALVGGGVGCHGIMYFEARHADLKTMPPTPMGAEGVPWIGLSPFVDEPHLIQNLGDGTLSHSGILAIRASVAAGVNVTFKILYNAAVAMTGGQDVVGLMDVPAMTRALEAEGVRRVVVCAEDPKHYGRRARWAPGTRVLGRDELPRVQEELRAVPGVTVVIYDQRCAAEARRLRRKGLLPEPPRRVVINEAVCEGCGDCGTKSNCLSVLPRQTEFGEKRQIDDLSCNRDYTCLEGDCPSFVTITPRTPNRWARRRGAARAKDSERAKDSSHGKNGAHGKDGARAKAGGTTAGRPVIPAGTLPAPPAVTVDGRFGIYFTGVGGTGVITANRIIAAAAESAGFVVSGVDQTGLSQKAGAVVSHLQLAADRTALGSSTVGSGGADLYLSGDILQAAAPRHLDRTSPGRTLAVVDVDVTPTAAMLQSDLTAPDPALLRQAIAERVGEDRAAFLDTKRIAEVVFANHLLANIVLLGAAFQLGGLPVSLADVEVAMRRQGRAAADNRAAFDWGRWAAHDPAAVEVALAAADQPSATSGTGTAGAAGSAAGASTGLTDPSPAALALATRLVAARALPAGLPDELRALIVRRAAQAVDYQNAARAERYLGLVATAAEHDAAAGHDPAAGHDDTAGHDDAAGHDDTAGHHEAAHEWAFTRAVAESWFRLLTYKDEYEVARLHLLADNDQIARGLGIDGPYTLTYHLHPPALRRLGLSKKLPMGRPYAAAFHVLRAMRGLRGTPFDLFGRDPDRRTERAVITEYEHLVTGAVGRGDGGADGWAGRPYEDLVRLAASATSIKGYGPIKEAAVARWREQIADLTRPVSHEAVAAGAAGTAGVAGDRQQ
ncbi:indolepyruvate ferredoxin oxidoreductase family protein [Frankia sp. Cpl3]|nr:indolepyruvate ferredoxin oxidoreductase family protein [Parafrankia colletiae]MCK9899903.1 indolepyruvate ferredoxin oxidoreductase family protein [Frankia sp. Cpl3]